MQTPEITAVHIGTQAAFYGGMKLTKRSTLFTAMIALFVGAAFTSALTGCSCDDTIVGHDCY